MLARRLSPIVALAFAAAPRVLTAQAKEYLYVGNTLGGDLSIIAIPEHKVVGTIPATVVGNSPDDVISSRNGDVLRYCAGVLLICCVTDRCVTRLPR